MKSKNNLHILRVHSGLQYNTKPRLTSIYNNNNNITTSKIKFYCGNTDN